MTSRRQFLQSAATAGAAALTLRARRARAEGVPGVSDSEIRIGQTLPYSGPASAYGVIGKAQAAYMRMINDKGGVNGRRLNLISLDDAYNPARTVEQVRRLVEQEGVAFLFNMLGTAPNLAVRSYLNDNKIPQLFVSTGASVFADPQHFPWTLAFNPNYRTEAKIYGKAILAATPQAKIALLHQNDGFGQDYLVGLQAALGPDRAGMIVRTASYETSEPSIDSQVIALQGSGADVFVIAATPKFAAQAIRKSFDLGWSATRYVSAASQSIATVLKPAGLDKAKDLISAGYTKDPTDLRWKDDAGLQTWREFCDSYLSPAEFADSNCAYGFTLAALLVRVLTQCGGDLGRDNILRQATNLSDVELPMLLPGLKVNTSPTNYSPIRQMQLARFTGESWELTGGLIEG